MDLGVIKFLVKHDRKRRTDVDTEEGIQLNGTDSLKEYLFGTNNEFSNECLNDNSNLGEYMRHLYKELVPEEDYKIPEIDNIQQSTIWSESRKIKSVFELQNRDKKFLDVHSQLNIALDWTKNLKMLLFGNREYFKETVHLKALLTTAAQLSKTNVLQFLKDEFPRMTFDHHQDVKDILESALASGNEEVLEFVMNTITNIRTLNEDFIKECYKTTNEISGQFLMKEFAYISDLNFIKESFKSAIAQRDVGVMKYCQNTIPESSKLDLTSLQDLLQYAVDKNFGLGIDFLVGNYTLLKELNESYVDYLAKKALEHHKIDSIQHLAKCYSSLQGFVQGLAGYNMSKGNTEMLTFFLNTFPTAPKANITYDEYDPELLISAMEGLQNPITDIYYTGLAAMRNAFEYRTLTSAKCCWKKCQP